MLSRSDKMSPRFFVPNTFLKPYFLLLAFSIDDMMTIKAIVMVRVKAI